MPQKTVITKIVELGKDGGISLYFPQNKVLYVDQLTGYAPDTSDERAIFRPSIIDNVFEHYRPCVEKVFLTNEDGECFYEDFCFSSMSDFDDDKLILQSETLSNSLYKSDAYYSIIRLLECNRELRRLLTDPEGKQALKEALKAMKSELTEQER